MKVFWSWQSDLPGKISRHFVRDALDKAISELKEEISIEEPERKQLHLDHDRKGLSGSPDLAQAIMKKVRDSAVFVADVTPVGKTPKGKHLMNANVAIEFGYALAKVGDSGILMILNKAYGDRDSLPFDLKHKAGPIIYDLSETAKPKKIEDARTSLVGTLRVAIRDCLNAKKKITKEESKHIEVPSQSNCSMYFKEGEVLARREVHGVTDSDLRYENGPLLYLRIIPTVAMPSLKESEIAGLIFGIKIRPLNNGLGSGASHERNKYGGMTFSTQANQNKIRLLTSTQLFSNREIWGIDSTPFNNKENLISAAFERILKDALPHYLEFGQQHLDLGLPLKVEAGAEKIEGFHLAMGTGYFEPNWGPIFNSQIKSRHTLKEFSKKAIDEILLSIFEDFFDATGNPRPENLHGFPKADE